MEVWLDIKSEIHFLIVCFLIAIFVVQPLLDYFTVGFDDSDGKSVKERSGFRVQADYKTGLQYLVTTSGTITPRLNLDGTQMIVEKE